LFSSDAELLNLGDFADILIEENQVGTTVKVDDQKSDPYAILSVINLNQQKVRKKDTEKKVLYSSCFDSFF
jgi:protein BCP1